MVVKNFEDPRSSHDQHEMLLDHLMDRFERAFRRGRRGIYDALYTYFEFNRSVAVISQD